MDQQMVHRLWGFLITLALLSGSAVGIPSESWAQVEVDPSALETLQGYEPPPMFGSAPTASPPPSIPPQRAVPKTEDLLNQPIKNMHVFTRQIITNPAAPQIETPQKPLLEIPVKPVTTQAPHTPIPHDVPRPRHKPKMAAPVPATAFVPSPATSAKQEKPKKAEAYRPQAPQTMPAVPPQKVEKIMLEPQQITTPPAHSSGSDHTLEFTSSSADLTNDHHHQLDTIVAAIKTKPPQTRILITAHASSPDGTPHSARRIALARALAVRDYMISQKIESALIDVRALGDTPPSQGSTATKDGVAIHF